MTQKEAKDYLRQESEVKIYPMMNGWLLMENCQNSGYNYVIPSEKEGIEVDNDTEKLIPRLGKWLVNNLSYVTENDRGCDTGRLFGWRVKVEVEPIYTDDYLLSTKLEKDE